MIFNSRHRTIFKNFGIHFNGEIKIMDICFKTVNTVVLHLYIFHLSKNAFTFTPKSKQKFE